MCPPLPCDVSCLAIYSVAQSLTQSISHSVTQSITVDHSVTQSLRDPCAFEYTFFSNILLLVVATALNLVGRAPDRAGKIRCYESFPHVARAAHGWRQEELLR